MPPARAPTRARARRTRSRGSRARGCGARRGAAAARCRRAAASRGRARRRRSRRDRGDRNRPGSEVQVASYPARRANSAISSASSGSSSTTSKRSRAAGDGHEWRPLYAGGRACALPRFSSTRQPAGDGLTSARTPARTPVPMRLFAQLYERLDRTTSTNAKVAALAAYFADGARRGCGVGAVLPDRPAAETPAALRVAAHLGGARQRRARLADRRELRGRGRRGRDDRARPRSHVRGARDRAAGRAAVHVDRGAASCRCAPQRRTCRSATSSHGGARSIAPQRFLLTKLLTGEFRVGVSHTLVVRALAQVAGAPREAIAHRLMGQWQPSGGVLPLAAVARHRHRGSLAALPVLPGVAARS